MEWEFAERLAIRLPGHHDLGRERLAETALRHPPHRAFRVRDRAIRGDRPEFGDDFKVG